MKTLFITLCSFLFLLGAFPEAVQAQETQQPYYVIDYMKTKPGMNAEYEQLEKAWKKIHKNRIDAGKLGSWALHAMLSPTGTHTEYNFVTFNRYDTPEQLAAHFETPMVTTEQLSDILTAEEIELVMRTGDIRDLVKSEVWSVLGSTMADDWQTGKIHVFNFFKNQPGMGTADHLAMETEIWQPIHAARVADNRMKGWGMLTLELPGGSQQPYYDATVDIYADMSQYLQPLIVEYIEKVHPNMSMDQIMEKFTATTDLTRREVRMVIDRVEGEMD